MRLRYIALCCILVIVGVSVVFQSSSNKITDCDACNIVVISVEPLNPDRMSVYGHDRNTTPFLDSLAEESLVYSDVRSSASITSVSTYSTLTGIDLYGHGVSNGELSEINDTQVVTLAERLNQSGYRTFALVEDDLKKKYGMTQGFNSYRYSKENYNGDLESLDVFMEDSEEPFFVYYESNGLHLPYHENGDSREDILETRIDNRMSELMDKRIPKSKRYDLIKEYYNSRVEGNETLERLARKDYDEGVHETDRFVRNVTELLQEHNVREDTIIVFTSQHSELLGKEGKWGHHNFLEPDLVRVPLVINLPSDKHRRIERRVNLLSLPYTLLDIVGVAKKGFAEQTTTSDSLIS